MISCSGHFIIKAIESESLSDSHIEPVLILWDIICVSLEYHSLNNKNNKLAFFKA